MVLLSSYKCNRGKNMDKENMIELLEDFIDFLKEKEDEKKEKEVEVMTTESEDDVEDTTDDDDDDFNNEIVKISKGE